MSQRRDEILQSIDNMVAVVNRWEDDPQADDFPVDLFRQALQDAAHYCSPTTGDIPGECFGVVRAMIDLTAEWELYAVAGKMDNRGRPAADFWKLYRGLCHERKGAVPIVARTIETPKLLRDQKLSDLQIAKAWGARTETASPGLEARWYGPFFDDHGSVRSDLIQKEVDDPGSVLGENPIPPAEQVRVSKEKSVMLRRLDAVEQRVRDTEAKRYSDAEVAALLSEGQYLPTICRVSQWSEEEVRAMAAEMGVNTISLPNLAAERGTYDKELTEADHASLRPREEKTTEVEPAGKVPLDEEAMEAEIIRLHEERGDELGAGDIAREVGTTPQKVGHVLKRHRESAVTV